YQAVAVGTRAVSNAVNSVALGVESSATALNGLAVGTSSSVRKEGGTAVGGGASALEEKSLALGFQAKGKAEKAVALGAQSIADLAAGQAGYDFATQSASQSEEKAWKSTLGAVSVGNEKDSRQITHVAA
ncbi:YadA-like family protein, partial [Neisseria sp. P0001.S004]